MSGPATQSRPARKSVGAALVGLVVTLAIFVVVFVTFLVAPLVALLVAYLVYAAAQSRQGRAPSPQAEQTPGHAINGFGAGAR